MPANNPAIRTLKATGAKFTESHVEQNGLRGPAPPSPDLKGESRFRRGLLPAGHGSEGFVFTAPAYSSPKPNGGEIRRRPHSTSEQAEARRPPSCVTLGTRLGLQASHPRSGASFRAAQPQGANE